MTELPFDEERAVERLMRLLSVPGSTGEEGPMRDFLVEELVRLGVPRAAIREDDAPTRIDLPCESGNLVVLLPGTVEGPRRLFSAHMDTVPLATGTRPVRRGERIVSAERTALGGDDRTGVGAILAALDEILRHGHPYPPLALVFTVREESGVRGARALRPEDLGGAALGFNLDGRDPAAVTTGAIGKTFIDIEVQGIAAHAGMAPERGVSAVTLFAAAAERLERDGWLGAVERAEGRGTSNIGAVDGGDATNVVTDRLVARAEARSHDSGFLRRIVAAYQEAFRDAAAARANTEGRTGQVDVRVTEAYDAYGLGADEPVVQAAAAGVRRLGLTPQLGVSDGGTDANWLVRHGVPSVSLGCGAHHAHTVDEYVSVPEYVTACRLVLELARS